MKGLGTRTYIALGLTGLVASALLTVSHVANWDARKTPMRTPLMPSSRKQNRYMPRKSSICVTWTLLA